MFAAPPPATQSPFFGNRGHIPGIEAVEASKLTPHLPDNTGCSTRMDVYHLTPSYGANYGGRISG